MSCAAPADAAATFAAALESGAYFEDSAPAWTAARQAGAMVQLPFGSGVWACTTWVGCAALARDPRVSAARARRLELQLPVDPQEVRPFIDLASRMVLYLDPPRHTQVRKRLNRAFTPEVIGRNRTRIAVIFEELLEEWIASGSDEIMETLIQPFPTLVIADWMGLPRGEWARFLAWADALLYVGGSDRIGDAHPDSIRNWLAMVEENRAYLESAAASRQPGGSDLFGLLMEREEGEELDREELVAQSLIILIAGHDTTRNLIGSGLHWMLSHACSYLEFAGEDIAQRLAVDEILRITSPVAMMGRLAAEDFAFGGATLRKGEHFLLAWASANRDPDHFPDPERMDPRRLNNPHLAFGAGPHACLGLHLARTEAQIAFERLFRRLPNLRLAATPPEWKRDPFSHGPTRLHVDYDGRHVHSTKLDTP